MKYQMWIIYCVTCIMMVIYLFWTITAITFQPRYQISCQQHMNGHSSEKHFQGNVKGNENYLKTTPNTILEQKKPHQGAVDPVQNTLLHNSQFPPTMLDGGNINPNISEFCTLKENEARDTFVNLHNYSFTANSKICSEREIFLIMIVHSAPKYKKKRNLIRTTFGSVRSYKGKQLGVVFLLGATSNSSVQKSINSEIKRYGDIVQGNFRDSYKNLVRKHVMAMHWFKYYCGAEFILKLDDDTFVNPFKVVDYLLNAKPRGLTIHCRLISNRAPVRSSLSKYYTPMSQYPFPIFPPFCIGFAYITTPETWTAMYVASKSNRMMDMDDVYVSVVLAMQAQVLRIRFDNILYPCPINAKRMEMKKLKYKAIVLDRKSRCGVKPFYSWDIIRDLYNENMYSRKPV